SLEAVLAVSDVAAVVTRPDAPQGRGRRVTPPPVAAVAAQYGLEVLQPPSLRAPEPLSRLRELRPDLVVVVAFGRIVPPEVLAVAPMGGINLHPSLLPRYRGAAPIPRAIAAGDAETGVTVIHLTQDLDAGDIILQRAVPIRPDDATATLEPRLARRGPPAHPGGPALVRPPNDRRRVPAGASDRPRNGPRRSAAGSDGGTERESGRGAPRRGQDPGGPPRRPVGAEWS